MSQRISIDPMTRIEGHLRIDCDIHQGAVSNAWVSGQSWRGIELILKGRDAREAWILAQRICGLCTTAHAVTSVRAVEMALAVEPPLNAQYIRNLMLAAHGIQDHLIHFYQLSSFDWVDMASAATASPQAAARLAQTLSDWHGNSAPEFATSQAQIQSQMQGGRMGIFGGGYWGHPAMTMPAELNLMVASHYFQALEVQRGAGRIVAILGGKTPHIQNLAIGGVSNSLDLDHSSGLTLERLQAIKTEIDRLGDFIHQVYLPDAAAVAAVYGDWLELGRGTDRYLAVPELPLSSQGDAFELSGGFFDPDQDGELRPFSSSAEPWMADGIKEGVKHSWYRGVHGELHPHQGETLPHLTDFDDQGKYSWVKAPSLHGQRVQVGPLADVLVMYLNRHPASRRITDGLLEMTSRLARSDIGLHQLRSTMGRQLARAVRAAVLHDALSNQWRLLMENLAKGDSSSCVPVRFPKGELQGVGFHAAPRGVLSHWVSITNGKITNYQVVAPTTWNAGPRDDRDTQGPYEAALLNTPVADPDQPLEILRTLHSFDPCLACAVHLLDTRRGGVGVKTMVSSK